MDAQESERSLFVLISLAAHMGAWQLALPGQPAAMRRAASALLEFAARSGAVAEERPVCCPPVSPDERIAARVPSSLGVNEGARSGPSAGCTQYYLEPIPGCRSSPR